uniref:SUEL-type lectin domain-containing protein n=1 Tax=Mesocestoides corti TaxID=53468 RepID=A0A5K3FT08_MESCO
DCIQPQRSGPLEIKAGGLDEVEIVCARKTTCEYDPITLIVDDKGIICRDFMSPRCNETYEGDITMINAVYPRPEGVDLSYVYCSTYNSFLSYAIDWANSA